MATNYYCFVGNLAMCYIEAFEDGIYRFQCILEVHVLYSHMAQ